MILDKGNQSTLTDIMGIGANLGAVFYASKQRNKDDILEFIKQKNSVENKSLKFIDKIMNPLLEELFKHMPLPRSIKKKQIINYIISTFKKDVKKQEINKKEKELISPLFLQFLEEVFSLRKEQNKEITKEKLTRISKTLKKLFSGFMDESIKSIEQLQNSLQRFYLESDFPSRFILTLNKMFDVLLTYYKYLENEVRTLFDMGIKFILEGKKIEELNDNPLFSVNIDKVLILQFSLYSIFIELVLFIEIWNITKLEDLFGKHKKTISFKKVNKKFFNKTIIKMDSTAEELHQIILDSVYKRKVKVPYTLEDNENITDNEKELLANLIL